MDFRSGPGLPADRAWISSPLKPRLEVCKACRDRVCIRVCPGGLWTVVEGTDEVRVECSGCLERGSCVTCCPNGGIDWAQPRGGCGVRYRCG
ncbi:MAG: hypothetical protein GYA57_18795 [Myxococcales bacterium]|nr:hypothetical protein [Myxococcales bacterium]